MSELEEHYLPFEDFKEEYVDVRETALFTKVFGQDPPATVKLAFCGRHDHLLETVKTLYPAAVSVLVVDSAFRAKDGTPFMISFDLLQGWRCRATQDIRAFTVIAFIEGEYAFLKINREQKR